MEMKLTKEFVNSCRKVGVLRDFLCQAIDQVDEKDKKIAELEEERRWRKFSEEKPDDKQWILVYYGYENNGCRIDLRRWDNGCKYDVEFQELYTKWMPLPSAPKDEA